LGGGRRLAFEPAAEAEHLAEPGEAVRLVHGQVEHDRGEEHEADHGAHPEALHAVATRLDHADDLDADVAADVSVMLTSLTSSP
jgi:hypothetical protein